MKATPLFVCDFMRYCLSEIVCILRGSVLLCVLLPPKRVHNGL